MQFLKIKYLGSSFNDNSCCGVKIERSDLLAFILSLPFLFSAGWQTFLCSIEKQASVSGKY